MPTIDKDYLNVSCIECGMKSVDYLRDISAVKNWIDIHMCQKNHVQYYMETGVNIMFLTNSNPSQGI